VTITITPINAPAESRGRVIAARPRRTGTPATFRRDLRAWTALTGALTNREAIMADLPRGGASPIIYDEFLGYDLDRRYYALPRNAGKTARMVGKHPALGAPYGLDKSGLPR
jgi:hypothetical protein